VKFFFCLLCLNKAKFGQLISSKIVKIVVRFLGEMHQIRFWLSWGLLQTRCHPLGELTPLELDFIVLTYPQHWLLKPALAN